MHDGSSLGSGQSGGDGDDAPSQGRPSRDGVGAASEHTGGAEQVVGDRRAQNPGRVGAEAARWDVCQWSVDQIGEHGFDDRVLAVGDVGLGSTGRSVLVKNG